MIEEYTIRAELVLGHPWTLILFHKGKEIRRADGIYTSGLEQTGSRFIREHMEKVTRMLEGGIPPENGEATDMTTLADHLAHKADHDNQVEKDLE